MKKEQIEEAKKRVKQKKEFFEHFRTYAAMSAMFFAINLFTSPGSWWFYWPIFGWGIGIVSHYFSVFGVPGVGVIDKAWEEQQLEKELRSMGAEEAGNPGEPPLDLNKAPRPEAREKKLREDWNEDELV
ncbi:MAG: 2TM domain-containing protein [Haliscomenobacter sp.]|nr:2TM domain-containing protein [Haliscomenobacter sp.]